MPVTLLSQDLLYFANGNRMEVEVINYDDQSVTFMFYNSTNNETYNALSNELDKLILDDGTIIEYKGVSGELEEDFTKNIVHLHSLDLPRGRITFTYEFLNENGTLGYGLPVSIGFAEDAYTDPLPEIFNIELYSIFYSGFKLNWYPLGQRKVAYVLGPEFRLGIGNADDYYYYDEYYYGDRKRQEYYSKLLINNGVIITPGNHFSLSFVISLGIMHRNTPPGNPKFGTTGDAAINVAFRF